MTDEVRGKRLNTFERGIASFDQFGGEAFAFQRGLHERANGGVVFHNENPRLCRHDLHLVEKYYAFAVNMDDTLRGLNLDDNPEDLEVKVEG